MLRFPAGLRPYGPPLLAGLAVDSFIIALEVVLLVVRLFVLFVLLMIVVRGLTVVDVLVVSKVMVCVTRGLILFSLVNII